MGIKLRKQIQTYGNSIVIRFNPSDIKVYNIKVGEIYDVELTKIDDKGGANGREKSTTEGTRAESN